MTNKSILVVDDDREFAESIALRCRSIGFDVRTACTPLAAIESMTAQSPDLLCLDVNMPTGNGLDLCEYLVREGKDPHKPVIILTGQTDRETIYRSLKLRTRYVRKSTEFWDLLRTAIAELLPPDSHRNAVPPVKASASKTITSEFQYEPALFD